MASPSFRRWTRAGFGQGDPRDVLIYIQLAVLAVAVVIFASSLGLVAWAKQPKVWLYNWTSDTPFFPFALGDYGYDKYDYSSIVKGNTFNRFITIWLENTDYSKAAGDPNLQFFAKQGITLTNYFALTHPSEPNYVAAISGDYYGIDNDEDNVLPANVSSIVDLLDDKGISWGEYQEYMPYTGFTGMSFKEPKTHKNGYVKKHNPAIMHASVANNATRRANTKNFESFYKDLKNNQLPQWIFITPDQQHNGHDTSVTYAGKWLRGFLEPLLKDPNFMTDTLVLVTFDENETYTAQNRVFSFLLGNENIIPKKLVGTKDEAYYNHYSEISTIQANWGLKTLGRYDVGANVFDLVRQNSGDKVRSLDITKVFNNESYPGIFNSEDNSWAPLPVPDTEANFAGRTVLDSIKRYWGKQQSKSVYKGAPLVVPTAQNPPVYPRYSRNRKNKNFH